MQWPTRSHWRRASARSGQSAHGRACVRWNARSRSATSSGGRRRPPPPARSPPATTSAKAWLRSSRSASPVGREGRRSMAEDVILIEVSEGVAVVTLNRPEARNALDPALTAALPEAIAACDGRDDVDAIVLTGADPAFCAGVDLKSLSTDREVRQVVGSDADALIRPFPETSKPVIGAVNGAAVTGGFEVALTCDFLVASERARFADTHARVGIMPGWGLTVLLAEAIGHRRAREMSVTGNFVDAPTALTWGLVNHVVPHDELVPFARRLALDVASNDQPGVRNVLATYREEERHADHETRRIELRRSREWLESASGVADEVARRREAIMERGRAQQG